MRKNIKWILLIILIISIIITIVLFISFKKQYGQDKLNNTNNSDDINQIYNKNWFNTSMLVYEDDVLISEQIVSYTKYMTMTNDTIIYCDNVTNECEEHNYTYTGNKINMPIDYFVFKGEYEITFDDENLYLSQGIDNVKVVYHFETAKG